MTADERRAFLETGSRTAVVAVVRPDGRPHAVPVWFALDGDQVLISSPADTVKVRALRQDPRVTLVVDDPRPPYAFVKIDGVAEVSGDPDDIRRGVTMIARRYLDEAGARDFVGYATGPGMVLVRIRPERVLALDRVGG